MSDWWKEARHMRDSGWKIIAIAAALNRSESGVRYALDPCRAKLIQARYRSRNRERLKLWMRKCRAVAAVETRLGLR